MNAKYEREKTNVTLGHTKNDIGSTEKYGHTQYETFHQSHLIGSHCFSSVDNSVTSITFVFY
jgi:hypothetical protein